MSNVLQFRKPGAAPDGAVREQAALWIARLDAGASAEDLQQIDAWLAQDAAHVQALLELAQLWDRMAVLGQLATMFPLDAQGRLQRVRRVGRGRVLATAASLLLALTMLWQWPHLAGDLSATGQFQASHATAVGEQRTVTLSDGSRIVMNTDTRLAIFYGKGVRRIELYSGEGLFEVAKDPTRPFQVHAGGRMVEAVGTAFSVHRRSEQLEVFVTEGRVLLHAGAGTQTTPAAAALPLNAGQYASLASPDASAVALDISTDLLEERLSWQHGMLLFRDEPLASVLAEVARYTTLDISADPSLLDIRVGGYFRVDDIDSLLAAIDTNFRIEIRRSGNQVALVPQ